MNDILDYFSTWSAFKWIILVLIAGFIGQFGKILAQTIIRKIQIARLTRQNPSAIEDPPTKDHSELPDTSVTKDRHAQLPVQDARIDKKALKILAKQSKKEAKNTTKQAKKNK
jgi:hypothetical protein